MSNSAPVRWPNFTEQLVIAVLVAALGWAASRIWDTQSLPAERALVILAGLAILAGFAFAYERFRQESVSVATSPAEYEELLTDLASKHSGTIDWITKTSIWADAPDAYAGRQSEKAAGIRSGRLTRLRYIIHLGHWRRLVRQDETRAQVASDLDLYRNKLCNLLAAAEDFALCPPTCVQFAIGELTDDAPPIRLGLYRSQASTTIVLGYDLPNNRQPLPRLRVSRVKKLSSFYERLFETQWERCVSIARQAPAYRNAPDNATALRRVFIDQLRGELDWLESRFPKDDIELESARPIHHAQSLLSSRGSVLISCPQKVCLSGDYGDMHVGGQTVTAAVNLRPHVVVRIASSGPSKVVVHPITGQGHTSDLRNWPLAQALKSALDASPVHMTVEIQPTAFMGLGLGSSGAASVLVAAVIALAERRTPTARQLIVAAHQLESETVGWACGQQDHISSTLGGLQHFVFPSLDHSRLPHSLLWHHLSFWVVKNPRQAHGIIPKVVADHTSLTWRLRNELARSVKLAFEEGDLRALADAFKREFAIQLQLGMPTEAQSLVVDAIEARGGAAKVSGAGGGGVLVVVATDAATRASVEQILRESSFIEIPLSVDGAGILAEVV